jgi:hypothetical protein
LESLVDGKSAVKAVFGQKIPVTATLILNVTAKITSVLNSNNSNHSNNDNNNDKNAKGMLQTKERET